MKSYRAVQTFVPHIGRRAVPPIITSALPVTPVYGVAYSHNYEAIGTLPIKWSIVAGALPTGLVLDQYTGILSGTPTVSGLFTWTVRASNSGGTATQTSTFLLYLFRDEFTTPAAAPLTSPRTAEPGPGQLTLVQNDGQFSISGGELCTPGESGAVPSYNDLGYYSSAGFDRVAGRALSVKLRSLINANEAFPIGWLTSQTVTVTGYAPLAHAIDINASFIQAVYKAASGINLTAAGGHLNGTQYEYKVVLLSSGALWFIRGGQYPSWTLLYVSSDVNTSPLYVGFNSGKLVGYLDDLSVRDLPAPFNTDFGIATFRQTAFTQSLGPELVVDGGFEQWDSPTNLTQYFEGLSGTSTINQTTDVHSGTYAVRIDTDALNNVASINQMLSGVVGDWFEVSFWSKDNVVGKSARAQVGSGEGANHALPTAAYRQFVDIIRSNASLQAALVRGNGASSSIYVDDFSAKKVTLNTPQIGTPDAMQDFDLTPPVAPIAGQRYGFRYRVKDDLNFWNIYAVRNDANTQWDFKVDSVVAGTSTNRVSATNVTATTLRVVVSGSKHNFYTYDAATQLWTKRGGEINISLYDTLKTSFPVYSSGVTPLAFTSYPVVGAFSETPELDVTAFTQSLGTELLANPDFLNWTGDNPDDWVVVGEVGSDPAISQVAPDGSAGTGAAKYYSSATLNAPYLRQAILVTGGWHEIRTTISTYASGRLRVQPGTSIAGEQSAAGQKVYLVRADTPSLYFWGTYSTPPTNFVVDRFSAKTITLNPTHAVSSDGIYEALFTRPASPVEGDRYELRFRIQDDLNYWVLYFVRNSLNNYDLKIDLVTNGTVTSKYNGSQMSSGPSGLRAIVNGDHITLEMQTTSTAPNWVNISSAIYDSTFMKRGKIQAVCTSGWTSNRLRSYPLVKAYEPQLSIDDPTPSFENVVASINPSLYFKYNEAPGALSVVNYGSVGAALNGTPSNVTFGVTGAIDGETGADFNGTTSYISVPNHASINALSEYTYAFLVKARSAGEVNAGRLFSWHGTVAQMGFNGSMASMVVYEDLVTVDALTTGAVALFAGGLNWIFCTYTHSGDKKIRLYRGVNGAVQETAYGTQTAGEGEFTAKIQPLFIGNVLANDRTFDGVFASTLIIPRVLTYREMRDLVRSTPGV